MSESASSADDVDERESALWDLPPSSCLLYVILRDEGPHAVSELSDRALMASSTTQRALGRLEDHDLVETRPGVDARKKVYSVYE
jgi:DNA-binding MarR family transcriptional regulator